MTTKTAFARAVSPASGNLLNLVALFFHLLPKNLLSFMTGALVRIRFPAPLGTVLCRTFARCFKLNLAEAELPLDDYGCIEDLFTRRLKAGARLISGPVCSPADGYLARSEQVLAGQAVQAKGLDYDLGELILGDGHQGALKDLAWYQTIYLAPHNYHRVHAPVSGRLLAVRHLPGQLWPVNLPFVLRIPQLFSRNERLVFDMDLTSGGRVYIVMVGAFNVGRMTTPLAPDFTTNGLERQLGLRPKVTAFNPPKPLQAGDEIGTFMLGSTVIIVYDRQALAGFQLVEGGDNRPILMGENLCARQI